MATGGGMQVEPNDSLPPRQGVGAPREQDLGIAGRVPRRGEWHGPDPHSLQGDPSSSGRVLAHVCAHVRKIPRAWERTTWKEQVEGSSELTQGWDGLCFC